MIYHKKEYEFVREADLKRITIAGSPFPIRNQKLIMTAEDEAYLREAFLERAYIRKVALDTGDGKLNLTGKILRVDQRNREVSWCYYILEKLGLGDRQPDYNISDEYDRDSFIYGWIDADKAESFDVSHTPLLVDELTNSDWKILRDDVEGLGYIYNQGGFEKAKNMGEENLSEAKNKIKELSDVISAELNQYESQTKAIVNLAGLLSDGGKELNEIIEPLLNKVSSNQNVYESITLKNEETLDLCRDKIASLIDFQEQAVENLEGSVQSAYSSIKAYYTSIDFDDARDKFEAAKKEKSKAANEVADIKSETRDAIAEEESDVVKRLSELSAKANSKIQDIEEKYRQEKINIEEQKQKKLEEEKARNTAKLTELNDIRNNTADEVEAWQEYYRELSKEQIKNQCNVDDILNEYTEKVTEIANARDSEAYEERRILYESARDEVISFYGSINLRIQNAKSQIQEIEEELSVTLEALLENTGFWYGESGQEGRMYSPGIRAMELERADMRFKSSLAHWLMQRSPIFDTKTDTVSLRSFGRVLPSLNASATMRVFADLERMRCVNYNDAGMPMPTFYRSAFSMVFYGPSTSGDTDYIDEMPIDSDSEIVRLMSEKSTRQGSGYYWDIDNAEIALYFGRREELEEPERIRDIYVTYAVERNIKDLTFYNYKSYSIVRVKLNRDGIQAENELNQIDYLRDTLNEYLKEEEQKYQDSIKKIDGEFYLGIDAAEQVKKNKEKIADDKYNTTNKNDNRVVNEELIDKAKVCNDELWNAEDNEDKKRINEILDGFVKFKNDKQVELKQKHDEAWASRAMLYQEADAEFKATEKELISIQAEKKEIELNNYNERCQAKRDEINALINDIYAGLERSNREALQVYADDWEGVSQLNEELFELFSTAEFKVIGQMPEDTYEESIEKFSSMYRYIDSEIVTCEGVIQMLNEEIGSLRGRLWGDIISDSLKVLADKIEVISQSYGKVDSNPGEVEKQIDELENFFYSQLSPFHYTEIQDFYNLSKSEYARVRWEERKSQHQIREDARCRWTFQAKEVDDKGGVGVIKGEFIQVLHLDVVYEPRTLTNVDFDGYYITGK